MSEPTPPRELDESAPLLDPADEAALAQALAAAYAPAALDPARHAEILAFALEDPLAPPSAEEARESERLRVALETGDAEHAGAALARALAAAANPAPLATEAAERLVAQAAPRKPNVLYVTFGALALAAAAGFALFVTRPAADTTRGELARSRTTQALFHAPFEPGQATLRIDRIASAREHDARENRYALWGVR